MNTKCVTCGEMKARSLFKVMNRINRSTVTGKYRVWKRSVFVDTVGRQWNGRECPTCKQGR